MYSYYSVNDTYGSGNTLAEILVALDKRTGSAWYCVAGSTNLNKTYLPVDEGVNVECLDDYDTMTVSQPVEDLEDLEKELEE